MAIRSEKVAKLRALHAGPRAFLSAHPWDAGTARVLTSMGFQALGTASSGLAFALGRRDAENRVSRDEMLAWAGGIAAATDLPVTGDLENGFGDAPEDCALTIRRAADAGLCGGSIEDATGRGHALYDMAHAAARIKAAADAARALPEPFLVIARADGIIHGFPALDDILRRVRAYEAAGADVIFVPGLPELDAIRAVCGAVKKPVTVLVGRGNRFTFKDLARAGVKEVGLGSTLFRAAWGVLFSAAREAIDKGTFSYETAAVPYETLNDMMGGDT